MPFPPDWQLWVVVSVNLSCGFTEIMTMIIKLLREEVGVENVN